MHLPGTAGTNHRSTADPLARTPSAPPARSRGRSRSGRPSARGLQFRGLQPSRATASRRTGKRCRARWPADGHQDLVPYGCLPLVYRNWPSAVTSWSGPGPSATTRSRGGNRRVAARAPGGVPESSPRPRAADGSL